MASPVDYTDAHTHLREISNLKQRIGVKKYE